LENAGKAGLVTIQGKISTVLGTILVCEFFSFQHISITTFCGGIDLFK